MIKELNLKCPYKVYEDIENSSYFFYTISKQKYIVYFTDANEYFNDFHLKNNIFSFGFEPQNSTVGYTKTYSDKNIKLTIFAIIRLFFKNENHVLTFVADISDLKQHARNRLFNMWKNENDIEGNFEKYDVEIETEDEVYYTSMILHSNNIHKTEYKQAFFDTTNELNKPD